MGEQEMRYIHRQQKVKGKEIKKIKLEIKEINNSWIVVEQQQKMRDKQDTIFIYHFQEV